MMFTVYKTTNLLDNKYYIGVHMTNDPADMYMGSGVRIIRAIAKYGHSNFRKDILFECDDEELAYFIESHLVTHDQVKDPNCYNLKPGGSGGGTVGNRGFKGKTHSLQSRKTISEKNKNRRATDETRKKLSRKKSQNEKDKISASLTGKSKSSEHKEKISNSVKERWNNDDRKIKTSQRMTGEKNHQYGSFWITNEIDNRKIRGEIPEGWRLGRILGPRLMVDPVALNDVA